VLAPRGLARAANQCRRVREAFPEVKIVVGRWGQRDEVERAEQTLKSAGADEVSTTLLETRSQLLGPEEAHKLVAAPPAPAAEPARA
jgi:hypothetical protein